ncbi:unnamed protein product [Dimorphilus gyrociliatus]|uniref:TM2 domain-containing protein n=1 Tax=Dimorphilus gyrociliatus TaxID=2664684 RepID=A0A7I8VF07_9ANNE|nr:unnamed protein product [Dimorphilus gyrociliatus]
MEKVPTGHKRILDAYVLAFPLGFLGAHHFYLNRPGWGVIYIFTFGLFGLGWVVDWFRLPFLVRDANERLANPERMHIKKLHDVYVAWLPLGGMLGFHHYYMGRTGWGVAYTFTLGFLTIGWLIDLFIIPKLLRERNKRIETNGPAKKSAASAYVICLFPITGLLGFHHHYLGRHWWGALYTFTIGLLGVGWLLDICRLKFVVERENRKLKNEEDNKFYIDDAYILCFPLGFLGLHQFYLKRYGWGVLYLLTFGLLGIGWITDWFRLSCLVNSLNKELILGNRVQQDPVIIQTTTTTTTTKIVTPEQAGSYTNPPPAVPPQQNPAQIYCPPSYDDAVNQPPEHLQNHTNNIVYVEAGELPPKEKI